MLLRPLVAGALAGALALASTPRSQSAPDLAIVNARVYTGDAAHPWAEAIAIHNTRIARVGTTAEIKATGGARMIDAGGRLLIPGFNDAHAHPGAMPESTNLDGPPAVEQDPTLDEILARISRAVPNTPPGRWIVGEIGAAVLDDPRATRATLDPLTPDHPLLLQAWTGHGAIVNSAALRLLKIGETQADPPGGFFSRQPDGKTLSGLAHEYADYDLRRRIAMLPNRAAQLKALESFAAESAAFGITSVQAMMTAYPAEDAAWIASASLPVRLRLIDFPLTPMKAWREPLSRRVKISSPTVTVSGTKWILDGTPIERLALLRQPYSDAPKTLGLGNFSDVDLREFLRRAMDARAQPIFHAVGDGAIGMVLDALEDTGSARWLTLRPRLEHGDMLQREDFARAARMGVVLVQNPSHFMIAPLLQQRLGAARVARADQIKATLAAGVRVAIGSDGVTNPYLNIMFAALNPANPSQAMTIEQALSAYTHGSAYAELAERQKGTIAAGMLADVALLSQDIFTTPLADLPKTTSLLTIVNGRVVHRSPAFPEVAAGERAHRPGPNR
ncbi:MAG: amidohydrolase [Vicinamibacterales bacterium]